jgi:hypothetical protein
MFKKHHAHSNFSTLRKPIIIFPLELTAIFQLVAVYSMEFEWFFFMTLITKKHLYKSLVLENNLWAERFTISYLLNWFVIALRIFCSLFCFLVSTYLHIAPNFQIELLFMGKIQPKVTLKKPLCILLVLIFVAQPKLKRQNKDVLQISIRALSFESLSG